MSFKTVLCVVGVHKQAADLRAAVSLCCEIDAHLSVMVVALAGPPPIGDYAAGVSDVWFEERARDQRELEAAVSTARELLDPSAISFDVSADYCEQVWAGDLIGERARYADLTLVGSDVASDSTLMKQVLNGCLFESGRPILLLSARGPRTLKPQTILLAWNSSVEAARAVQQSLELMVAAKEVHVVMIDPNAAVATNGEEPGADIGAYLARHGVTLTVEPLPSAGRSVADVLRQRAIDISADLIVMGAYGHSRMRERLFGGVTRAMLDAPDVPVLMAH